MPIISIITSFFSTNMGKYIIFAVTTAGIVLYFNIRVSLLESKNTTLQSEITSLKVDLRTETNNLEASVAVNKINVKAIQQYKKDVEKLKSLNSIIISSKDKDIEQLKRTLKNLKRPVIYTSETKMKDCIIKVKETPDENDTIFTDINSIGL